MTTKKAADKTAAKPTAAPAAPKKPVTTRATKPAAKPVRVKPAALPTGIPETVKSAVEELAERPISDFFTEIALPQNLGTLRIYNPTQLANVDQVGYLPDSYIARVSSKNFGVERLGLSLVRSENWPKEVSAELTSLLVDVLKANLTGYHASSKQIAEFPVARRPRYALDQEDNRSQEEQDIAMLLRVLDQAPHDYEVSRRSRISLNIGDAVDGLPALEGQVHDVTLTLNSHHAIETLPVVITAGGVDFKAYASLRRAPISILQLNVNDTCAFLAQGLLPLMQKFGSQSVSVRKGEE